LGAGLTVLDIGANTAMTLGGAPGVFLGGTYLISAKVIVPWFNQLPPLQQELIVSPPTPLWIHY